MTADEKPTDRGDGGAQHGVNAWRPDDSGRRWWKAERLNDLAATSETLREIDPTDHGSANLISSRRHDDTHAPVVDLDHRARLLASSTPGHHHLYIDQVISWRQYRALLRGLWRSGLIDASVYWRSLDREATYVRPPGVHKTDQERNAGSIDQPPDPDAARKALRVIRRRVLRRYPNWWRRDLAAWYRTKRLARP